MSYFRNLLSDTRRGLAARVGPPRQEADSAGHDLVIIGLVSALVLVLVHRLPGPVSSLPRNLAQAVSSGSMVPGWQELIAKLLRGLLILILCFASLPLIRVRPADLGWRWGNARTWALDVVLLYVLMLPPVYWASLQPSFQRAYPYFEIVRAGTGYLVLGLAVRLFYMVAWEFLFRGYLYFGFERRHGPAPAITASTIPFVLMHFGKPMPEVYGSIVAGLVLGIVAFRARSFIPCAVLHFAVAATLDLVAL